jgi:hypothetical protein
MRVLCCLESNLNDLFLTNRKLPPFYIKKYMEWQVVCYPIAIAMQLLQSITMHVIFYQCCSQLCPRAYHFNCSTMNQHHKYQYYRSQHSFYQPGRTEDLFCFDPCCIPEISWNIIVLVFVLQLVMLNEHVAKMCIKKIVDFFFGLNFQP